MAVIVTDSTTGIVVEVPEHYLDHPVLGINLVPVEDKPAKTTKKQNLKATTRNNDGRKQASSP